MYQTLAHVQACSSLHLILARGLSGGYGHSHLMGMEEKMEKICSGKSEGLAQGHTAYTFLGGQNQVLMLG